MHWRQKQICAVLYWGNRLIETHFAKWRFSRFTSQNKRDDKTVKNVLKYNYYSEQFFFDFFFRNFPNCFPLIWLFTNDLGNSFPDLFLCKFCSDKALQFVDKLFAKCFEICREYLFCAFRNLFAESYAITFCTKLHMHFLYHLYIFYTCILVYFFLYKVQKNKQNVYFYIFDIKCKFVYFLWKYNLYFLY